MVSEQFREASATVMDFAAAMDPIVAHLPTSRESSFAAMDTHHRRYRH